MEDESHALLENLTDEAIAVSFLPFPCNLLKFTSHKALHKRHQSKTAKAAKTLLIVQR